MESTIQAQSNFVNVVDTQTANKNIDWDEIKKNILTNTGYNENFGYNYYHQGSCPNCGYCPHCGRSNSPYRTGPYWTYDPDRWSSRPVFMGSTSKEVAY